MSTRVEGATVVVLVTAVHATLSAGPAHLVLSGREGPARGTWRYNLGDNANSRIQYGRIAGITDHMDVLRYAVGMCKDAFRARTTRAPRALPAAP